MSFYRVRAVHARHSPPDALLTRRSLAGALSKDVTLASSLLYVLLRLTFDLRLRHASQAAVVFALRGGKVVLDGVSTACVLATGRNGRRGLSAEVDTGI
jgi:hypothetical protein